ncbi:Ig-like domain-containing protein [Mycobacterium sp. IDR2000157661]|uniref:Ig-like domain-containing protein n=1 Tax=Mycobacterium sp. IDR2000157661 TaxID=2867005 RepID=UPI001EEC36B5|nr:VCBS domain-containing protein [Mycobacterium sp. IDR2000157661]ULE31581.1 VCBS domain-containing protein [Mycobacterium sp. IDR2000157661]
MTAVSHMLAWVGAFAGAVPGAPLESPLLLLLMSWMRRESQQSLVRDVPVTSLATTTTGQSFDPLPETDAGQPPSVIEGVGTTDPVTGEISGSLNPAGTSLTYTLIQGSSMGGSVLVNADGTFRYTPTTAARLAAAQTMGVDLDSFTVEASDGQTASTSIVRVAVSPANLSVATNAGQTGYLPGGVAVIGDRAYVANQGSNTVSVIDISTPAPVLLATIPVGWRPTAVAAGTADGSRIYVTNSWSHTVSVIDTSAPTPTVIATIPVGYGPTGITVSPYGSRAYVVNTSSGTVSVIDTAVNRVTATVWAGYSPGGAGLSPDGTRLYVTSLGGWTVSVIDTTTPTPTVLATVGVGAAPSSVAVGHDRAFVANQYSNTVSIIDTTGPTPRLTATVSVGPAPTSIVLSKDGTAAYVANSDDTVSVIDVAGNRLLRTITVDPQPEWGAHSLVLSADGSRLYVADAYDGALRSVSLVTGTSIKTGHAPLVLPGGHGYTVPATWYFPNKDEPPVGVVYLQHGFYRSSANVSALARELAESTNSVVVTPDISSNYFDPYNIWGSPIQRAVASMFSGDRAALTASASAAAGYSVTLPKQVVLAGHSAGGTVVSAAAGYMADSGDASALKAVILYDSVDTREARVGLAKLSGVNAVPVYLIAAQPCSCNYGGQHAYNTLTSPPSNFTGIMLDGGGHLDAEGETTNWYATFFCGAAQPNNAAAVRNITASWVTHVFTGSTTEIAGPVGTVIHLDNATVRIVGSSGALAA